MKTSKLSKFNDFVNEHYLNGVTSKLIDKDWDELYDEAQENPLKTKIKKALVEVFKDKDLMVAVADNYEWSDGSNGFINFSNLNHFITDIGYKSYADEPSLIEDTSELKQHIYHSYASSRGSDMRRGMKYKNFKYDPKIDFSW